MNSDWMKDPRLSSIDATRLVFLQKLVFDMQSLSDKEKLPFIMALATSTKKMNLDFTKEEINSIISVIKEHCSEDDLSKMNKVLSMFSHT